MSSKPLRNSIPASPGALRAFGPAFMECVKEFKMYVLRLRCGKGEGTPALIGFPPASQGRSSPTGKP
jgi:hypothetical protein